MSTSTALKPCYNMKNMTGSLSTRFRRRTNTAPPITAYYGSVVDEAVTEKKGRSFVADPPTLRIIATTRQRVAPDPVSIEEIGGTGTNHNTIPGSRWDYDLLVNHRKEDEMLEVFFWALRCQLQWFYKKHLPNSQQPGRCHIGDQIRRGNKVLILQQRAIYEAKPTPALKTTTYSNYKQGDCSKRTIS